MAYQITRNGTVPESDGDLADLELHLLLEAVFRHTGQDFRNYSQATLKRRIADRLRGEDVTTISALQDRVLHQSDAMSRLALAMSGGSGRVFNDAAFFQTFRTNVVPLLRTYSFTRIWIPHCASGEDVYSVATVLFEEGLLGRTMIYATDPSAAAIEAAKGGTFAIESPEHFSATYRATGGTGAILEMVQIKDTSVQFDKEIVGRSAIFAQHSLVGDGALNEFHLIVARGVLPQFNRGLQYRAHGLFLDSLVRLGFLCLGQRETLRNTPYEKVFRQIPGDEAIFRRMR